MKRDGSVRSMNCFTGKSTCNISIEGLAVTCSGASEHLMQGIEKSISALESSAEVYMYS